MEKNKIECPSCHTENSEDSRFCKNCASPLTDLGIETMSMVQPVDKTMTKLLTGTIVSGKYKVTDELGRGGMGVVYKAEDTKLMRTVALKFLPPELASHPEAQERFLREARAAAALSHPNICTIYEIGEEEENPYIAMEYIDGMSLRQRTIKYLPHTDEAVEIAVQIASGLEAAHSQGVVHRDIKSANIMINRMGQAKVMDFGLAKISGGSLITREPTTMGTVAYMSPEQARGETVDHRTDIWSLGVILYEILTGRLPFFGEQDSSVMYAIVHEDPKPVRAIKPSIPDDLQRIINKALKKDPKARYSSAAEMLQDLKAFQERRVAEEAGVFNIRSFLKRLRQPRFVVPALVIFLALCAAAFWYFNRQARIRYARQDLIPQIESMLETVSYPIWEGADEILKVAEQAEKYIPDDPKLQELLTEFSQTIYIKSEPSGAEVFMRHYNDDADDWTYLGITPIESIRIPKGIFIFRFEKEGYLSGQRLDMLYAGHRPGTGEQLVKQGTTPPDMVMVRRSPLGTHYDGTNLGKFYVDKYEVTNKKYKEFIDSGGYTDERFWKYPFVKEGRELTWEQAMQEFRDSTGMPGPATWQAGTYPEGQEDYPVSGVSWHEAAAYAEYVGKMLPTIHHWDLATDTDLEVGVQYSSLLFKASNFGDGPAPVGEYQGINRNGTYDMAGNVREWCWNETTGGRCIRGGAWDDEYYMYRNVSQAQPFDRSPTNGFRCVKHAGEGHIPESVFQPYKKSLSVDYYEVEPFTDEVFDSYKRMYDYDKIDLDAVIEETDESHEYWIKQKVSFTPAYEEERTIAYVFLPKGYPPPYQAILFWPGGGARFATEVEREVGYYDFYLKTGRALVYPILQGTYHRNPKEEVEPEEIKEDGQNESTGRRSQRWTQKQIRSMKDHMRTIDYLETRPDMDVSKLGFHGFSWGGAYGLVLPALENRIKAQVLVLGGIYVENTPEDVPYPEVAQINFIPRVKIPTLMLNGKYDLSFPCMTNVKPVFDLLGTPKEDKESILCESDHYIPRNIVIKESLQWFNKYLGPVERDIP